MDCHAVSLEGAAPDARPGVLPEAAAAALPRLVRRRQESPQHRQRRQEVRQERRVPALRQARPEGAAPDHLPRRQREGVAEQGQDFQGFRALVQDKCMHYRQQGKPWWPEHKGCPSCAKVVITVAPGIGYSAATGSGTQAEPAQLVSRIFGSTSLLPLQAPPLE